jgi:outer membrane immunogenic protein
MSAPVAYKIFFLLETHSMKIALSAVALIASSIGAFAADLPARTEAPAPLPPSSLPTFAAPGAPDWSGFYVGGALAARRDAGKNSLSDVSYALPAVGTDGATNSRTSQTNTLGALGGKKGGNTFGGTLFGGYNVQVDSFVYGVEADITYSHDRSKARSGSLTVGGQYADVANTTAETNTAAGVLAISQTNRINWDGSLRARIGMVAAPSLLVFATGGVAVGRVERSTGVNGTVSFVDYGGGAQATHNFSSKSESNKIRLGWTVGAGADYKLTESWTLRADYRYTNFGKNKGSASSTATCVDGAAAGNACANHPVGTVNASTSSTDAFHAVRVGVAYKFGGDILPSTLFARY